MRLSGSTGSSIKLGKLEGELVAFDGDVLRTVVAFLV